MPFAKWNRYEAPLETLDFEGLWWNIKTAHVRSTCWYSWVISIFQPVKLAALFYKHGNNSFKQFNCQIPHTLCSQYSEVPLQYGQFSPKYSRKTPHGSPVRVRYGVSFVGSASDWYSAAVPAMLCALSYYIILCYNGTWLYIPWGYLTVYSQSENRTE